MKKWLRPLALTLAVAMLLSMGALAAEEEGGREAPKELWMQWVGWEEPVTVQEEEPVAGIQPIPGEEYHLMFLTCEYGEDGERTFTPVPADKLEASEGMTLTSLAKRADEKDELRDCYISLRTTEWDKDYIVSYDGYSTVLHTGLPEVGFYWESEATTENYARTWGFSPTRENESLYIISIASDETHGRHMVDLALAEGVEDNARFSLEKVEDNIYKITRKGGRNYVTLEPRLDITWQEPGGEPYTDHGFGIWSCENATFLVSEEPVPTYEWGSSTRYDDVKDSFTDQVTMEAGESKDVYLCFTFFTTDYEEKGAWIMRNMDAVFCEASDSALKLTTDSEDPFKLTLTCDVPGTYTFNFSDSALISAEVRAVYHADGTAYTEAEFEKFLDETGWSFNLDGELLFFNDEHEEGAPFEELFPGETIDYDVYYEDPWYPITVTVTGEETPAAFTDVAETAWYAPAVAYASGKGLMNGTPEGAFNPGGHITAAQLTQILYNRENKPAAAEGAAFQGVNSQWYAAPVLWAAGEGIITDTGDTALIPTEDLTRQQIALILYNYMDKPEGSADLTVFSDSGQISGWAVDAVAWAVGAEVLSGSESGGVRTLNPAGTATRAETAQILMNFFA